MKKFIPRTRSSIALFLFALLLVGGAVAFRTAPAVEAAGTAKPLASSDVSPLLSLDQAMENLTTHVTPSVVTIEATQKVQPQQQRMPQGMFPFFGPFQQMPQRPQYARDSGSGVIISPDGYIVTNHHVVGSVKTVQVILSNGTRKNGKVVGSDKLTDLAVVKIDGSGYPALPWGDSTRLKPGQTVLAFGTPFGMFQSTVTRGIVSAVGRPSLDSNRYRPGEYIQTDAAINPGNSGGALVDVRGELVGINTMIVSPDDAFAGVGFAIPTRIVRPMVEQLMAHGHATHGYLGVGIETVTPENAHFFKVTTPNGALVTQVDSSAPGGKAGLKVGDVITAIDGHSIKDSSDLQVTVQLTAPGTTIHMQVQRDGKTLTLPVTVEAMPSSAAEGQLVAADDGSGNAGGAHLGIQVQDLTPDLRNQLNLPSSVQGVIVAGVQPGGPADNAGIGRGMIIEQVNRHPVSNADELHKQLTAIPANQDILLLIWAGNGSSYIVVHPTQPVE